MRWAMGAVLFFAVAGTLFLAGCGEEEVSTPCEYCEHWDLLLDGFGRFPAFSPDPAQPDRIAFSSRLPDTNSVVDEDRFEHIWVLDGEDLYRITDDEFNDFEPAWSPDGNYLAFTRELAGRLDIWTVGVVDLAAPGVPVRLTSEANVEVGASEASWLEDGDGLWVVFASEDDIYRIPSEGGSPIKLVPDPVDVGGSSAMERYPDFQPAVGPDGRVAFTSVGRGETGNLGVSGFFVEASGETLDVTDAAIFLDGVSTGFYLPHTFNFLPVKPDLGPYTVSVESPRHCDRRYLYPVVRPNQSSSIQFNFYATKGDVYIWVYQANCNIYDIFEGDTTFVFRLGTGFPEPDSSTIACLAPGEHRIWIEWNAFDRDTTVTVTEGETDTLRVYEAKGSRSKVFMSPFGGRTVEQADLARPVQVDHEQVWVADLVEHHMIGFWSLNSQFERPCWSPDGEYVAFLASDPIRNRWGIRVAEVGGSSASWSVPLPGSSESASCSRSAYQLSWNSAGDRMAVAMGGCEGHEGPQDIQIWLVDPRPFLGK